MAYIKQEWKDYPYTTTPINSTRLNHMEDGIANALAKDNITTDMTSTEEDKIPNTPTVKKYIDNTNTYSTDEIEIGKYIDGKPLYRKVINIGNLPNSATKDVPHGIENLSAVITMKGYASDTNQILPISFTHASAIASQIQIYISEDNLKIVTSIDRSAATGYVILEYTKTTD